VSANANDGTAHRYEEEVVHRVDDELLSCVRRRFADSPLAAVGDELERSLLESSDADNEPLRTLVEQTLNALPRSYGKRFLFDAFLIGSITRRWSSKALRLSRMVVPRYGSDDWAHTRLPMPTNMGDHTHVVEVMLLPGNDDIEEVKLLAYPWLFHELAHLVLSRPESTFMDDFTARLDDMLSQIDARRGVVLGPDAKDEANAIKRIESYWKPTADQGDWSHELAADATALWTCGPAFIDTFENHVDDASLVPHVFEPPHPPHRVRLLALVSAARKLGWHKNISRLALRLAEWQHSEWARCRPVRVHVIDEELIWHVVEAAFAMCRSLRLPRCTPTDVGSARQILKANRHPDFGIELLLAARLYHAKHGQAAYEVWERKLVEALAESVEF
jgi:hypothetical protein